MMTINIKIELSALEKTMTEVKALENMILDLAKTYPTKFAETPVEELVIPEKTEEKPKRKSRVTKAKPEPVVEKEVETAPEPSSATTDGEITLKELTDLARTIATANNKEKRDDVKELIATYGNKLSNVLEADYETLADALKAL